MHRKSWILERRYRGRKSHRVHLALQWKRGRVRCEQTDLYLKYIKLFLCDSECLRTIFLVHSMDHL
jgi:hypothetical protein